MNTTQDNQRQAVLYAYLAGIIDGEGTIRIGKVKTDSKGNPTPTYYSNISVGMTDKRIIDLLSKTFGASTRIERVPFGRKTVYRWGTSGSNVIPNIISKIIEHLIVKKTQAELVLEFCKSKQDYKRLSNNKLTENELQRREELFQKVKKLNAVGAAATTKSKDTGDREAIV